MSKIPPKPNTPLAGSPEALRQQAFDLLRTNLPAFAQSCLKIRDKQGQILPFVFNRAQLYAHACLEKQKKEQLIINI